MRRNARAVILFVGAAGELMIAVQGLTSLIALALERRFGADLAAVGRAMGVITLATSLGCLPVDGAFDRRLSLRRGRLARPLVMAATGAVATPCAIVLPLVEAVGQAFAVVAAFLFLTCTANALEPTILQDIAPPAIRSQAFDLEPRHLELPRLGSCRRRGPFRFPARSHAHRERCHGRPRVGPVRVLRVPLGPTRLKAVTGHRSAAFRRAMP